MTENLVLIRKMLREHPEWLKQICKDIYISKPFEPESSRTIAKWLNVQGEVMSHMKIHNKTYKTHTQVWGSLSILNITSFSTMDLIQLTQYKI